MSIKGSIWKEKHSSAIVSILSEIEQRMDIKVIQKRHYFGIWKGNMKRMDNFLFGIHIYEDYFKIITNLQEEFNRSTLEETKQLIIDLLEKKE